MNQSKTKNSLAKAYDLYGPMLYAIALEISGSENAAEEIIYETFQKFISRYLMKEKKEHYCAILIKLMIQSAHEQLNNNSTEIKFKVKQFQRAPLLHKLICELVSIEDHCKNNNMTRIEVAKIIREEFNLIFRPQVISNN